MRNRRKKIILSLIILGSSLYFFVLYLALTGGQSPVGQAIESISPVTRIDMKREHWLGSKVGEEFNTPTGLPEAGTYAVMHDGYWFGMSNTTYEIEYLPFESDKEAQQRIKREKLTQIFPTGNEIVVSDFEFMGRRYAKFGTDVSLKQEYDSLKDKGNRTPALTADVPTVSLLIHKMFPTAYGAIAKDNQKKQGCGGSSSCSSSFTTSGSDRYLMVMTYHNSATLTSVTHNSNTLTSRTNINSGSNYVHHHAYGEADTSGNIVSTLSASAGAFRWHAQSYTGADTTSDDNGTDGTAVNTGTSITCTHSPTTDDHYTWMSTRSLAGEGSSVSPSGFAFDTFFNSTGVQEVESTSAKASGSESVTTSGHTSGVILCIISEIAPAGGGGGGGSSTPATSDVILFM